MVGPTRRRPAKNSEIAPTVEITARHAIQPHPAPVNSPGRSSPSSNEPTVNDTAAPVQTSAESTSGGTRDAIPSETRM